MSNYPPPQYGGGYGSHDQNNLPYLPPAYPPQYYPPNNPQGVHGQVDVTSNYNAYGYNQVMPAFGAVPTPGISPLPLFQGWNQDQTPLPSYSSAPQQSPYNGYTPVQHQSQHHAPVNQMGWSQPIYNASTSYDQQDTDDGEYRDNGIVEHAPPPNHTFNKRRSSIGDGPYRQPSNNHIINQQRSPVHRTPSSGTLFVPLCLL